ncbi:MAG: RpiB/LacA/LacB family sugar-phosphate isomerase [Clostridium sp.]|nr:RpiB/LacA/LacB family sugar-phosphate isomerase [Clostridium sp.]
MFKNYSQILWKKVNEYILLTANCGKKEINMKLGITSDHRGFKLKTNLFKKLEEEYQIIDFGTFSEESVDYPDYAFKLSKEVANKNLDYGIAICGSGIGISIACNKVKGIRAARVVSLEDVLETRTDNDANIICLSEKLSTDEAYSLVKKFIETPFSTEERHHRRIEKIAKYEDSHEC